MGHRDEHPLPHPHAGAPILPSPALSDLGVRVVDEEVGQCHDEDGNGHPEVPDQAPDLWGHREEPCVAPPAQGVPPLQEAAMTLHGLSH